jgi:hypothetical protein
MSNYDTIQAHEHLLQATNALHQAERYHLIPVQASKYLYHAQIHIAKAGAHYAKSIQREARHWEDCFNELKRNPYVHRHETEKA